jgi:hypothetical protein
LFTERRYRDASSKEQIIQIIDANIDIYKQYNFIGTILSISYFINFLCRLTYNTFSKKKIKMDIWMIFDIIAGTLNLLAFNIVGNSSA